MRILFDFRRLFLGGETTSEQGESWVLARTTNLGSVLLELEEWTEIEPAETPPDAARSLLESILRL
jgi:hypothetical protein